MPISDERKRGEKAERERPDWHSPDTLNGTAEWSALISRGQEKWSERVRARVLSWRGCLRGRFQGSVTMRPRYFSLVEGTHANVGNSIHVTFPYEEFFFFSREVKKKGRKGELASPRRKSDLIHAAEIRVNRAITRLCIDWSFFLSLLMDESSSEHFALKRTDGIG